MAYDQCLRDDIKNCRNAWFPGSKNPDHLVEIHHHLRDSIHRQIVPGTITYRSSGVIKADGF